MSYAPLPTDEPIDEQIEQNETIIQNADEEGWLTFIKNQNH